MKDPILITGCARSGTSLVAGIINMCGAFGGKMSGPNRYNEKGMFENAEIRNRIVKPYLRKIGVDPLGQYPLPNVDGLKIPVSWKWRKDVCEVMQSQGYKDGEWMYKGAKICLFWPVWDVAFPNAKWVIVRRSKDDIVNSCLRTGFMRAFARQDTLKKIGVKNEKEGWLWWVQQHLERFEEMYDVINNLHQVWPHFFIERGDFEEIKELIKKLGLKWNDAVYEFVDKKLWNNKK